MGLFGGEVINVSSVVYNLAGDLAERPDYLKTTVASNVISHSNFGMSETLNSAYINGPGIKIRSWHRWCRTGTHYDQVGVPYSRVADESDLTPYAVASAITPSSGSNYVSVSTYSYGAFDHNKFAQQFMLQYHYPIYTEAWTSAYDDSTGNVIVTRADGTTTYSFSVASFYDPDVDGDSKYIYSMYIERVTATDAYVATLMFIYKIGTGDAVLDELVLITDDSSDEFLPIIPVRFKNQFISDTYKPAVYAQTTKAYKKLTGGSKLSKLVEKIADNEDIDDIDHAFIMQGVSVNTVEPKSRKYIVHFFARMMSFDPTSWAAYATMESVLATYQADLAAWRESRSTWSDEHPGEPFPPPPVMPAVITPTKSITIGSKIGTDNTDICDITIKWKAMTRTDGTGLGKPDAKVQEVWWSSVTENSMDDEVVTIYWQDSEDTWTSYTIIGLHFINDIYKGESFKIGIKEALTPDDEYVESPFIIPLHYDTLKSMSLVDSTQVVTSSSYLVLNCYEVVKQPWYATIAFKIFIFIVMIAVVVLFPPAGALIGPLGTAAGVGAALGLTGLMAVIVGAIVNALAAMIIMQIIMRASVAIFGAKLGMIIGTIVGFVALTMGTPMMNGASVAQAWGNMMSASNLIMLTNSVGNGVAGYLQASTMEFALKTEKVLTEYQKQSHDIMKQWFDQFGLGAFAFDANQLTNNNPGGLTEPPQMFLDRTLMTGSDIAGMSLDMITDFASLTLAPPTMGS